MINLLTLGASNLPFIQQLEIAIASAAVPLVGSVVLFVLMFRYLPSIMETFIAMIGKGVKTEYNCQCERCRAKLRTKKGLKQWKKDHKFKKDDWI